MVDRVDIQSVLDQMRTLRTQFNMPDAQPVANNQFANTVEQMRKQIAAAQPGPIAPLTENPLAQNEAVAGTTVFPSGDVPSFGEMFKSAVDTVNANQSHASEMATRYEMGDPKVDLPEVMIALQKSSVSFQAMTQVRNKMIEAYKEIINMPL